MTSIGVFQGHGPRSAADIAGSAIPLNGFVRREALDPAIGPSPIPATATKPVQQFWADFGHPDPRQYVVDSTTGVGARKIRVGSVDGFEVVSNVAQGVDTKRVFFWGGAVIEQEVFIKKQHDDRVQGAADRFFSSLLFR